MDETLKQALEALKFPKVAGNYADGFNDAINAAIAAIEQHKPVVRMLSDEEINQLWDDFLPRKDGWAGAIQHAFAEINGLTIGEHG